VKVTMVRDPATLGAGDSAEFKDAASDWDALPGDAPVTAYVVAITAA
jgi:hypothetical protein